MLKNVKHSFIHFHRLFYVISRVSYKNRTVTMLILHQVSPKEVANYQPFLNYSFLCSSYFLAQLFGLFLP
jgi:hypothetical protein